MVLHKNYGFIVSFFCRYVKLFYGISITGISLILIAFECKAGGGLSSRSSQGGVEGEDQYGRPTGGLLRRDDPFTNIMAHGIARGLAPLGAEAGKRVVHRDMPSVRGKTRCVTKTGLIDSYLKPIDIKEGEALRVGPIFPSKPTAAAATVICIDDESDSEMMSAAGAAASLSRAPDALISMAEIEARVYAKDLLNLFWEEETEIIKQDMLTKVINALSKYNEKEQKGFAGVFRAALMPGMSLCTCVNFIEALSTTGSYAKALDLINASVGIFTTRIVNLNVDYRANLICMLTQIPTEKHDVYVAQACKLSIDRMSPLWYQKLLPALKNAFEGLALDEKKFENNIAGLIMVMQQNNRRFPEHSEEYWASFMLEQLTGMAAR